MDWLYYLILVVVLLTGLALNAITMPGNWLMLVAMILYGWATGWAFVSWPSLVILLAMATVGEIIEFFAAGAATNKVGGSKRGAAGAILGGLLGGIFLSFLVPIPIVGTIVGLLAGTFIGAALGEVVAGKEMGDSMFIGAVATKGRLYGTLLKLVVGVVMLVYAAMTALPVRILGDA